MCPVETLIHVQESQKVVLGLEIGELAIEPRQIDPGTVALLLQESDVIVFLELMHFILFSLHLFVQADKFVLEGSGRALGTLRPHLLLRGHVFVHARIEEGLRVTGRLADDAHHEDRGVRYLPDLEADAARGEFGMESLDSRHGALPDLVALHQFDLGAEKVHQLFVVTRPFRELDMPGHHHPANRLIGRRKQGDEPGAPA